MGVVSVFKPRFFSLFVINFGANSPKPSWESAYEVDFEDPIWLEHNFITKSLLIIRVGLDLRLEAVFSECRKQWCVVSCLSVVVTN